MSTDRPAIDVTLKTAFASTAKPTCPTYNVVDGPAGTSVGIQDEDVVTRYPVGQRAVGVDRDVRHRAVRRCRVGGTGGEVRQREGRPGPGQDHPYHLARPIGDVVLLERSSGCLDLQVEVGACESGRDDLHGGRRIAPGRGRHGRPPTPLPPPRSRVSLSSHASRLLHRWWPVGPPCRRTLTGDVPAAHP